MPTSLSRRRMMLMTGTVAAMAILPAMPAFAAPVLGDVPLGSEDAPVTVIEYASYTCPHCQAFHVRTWPEIKEKYVDTGKVKFILREVYFDQLGLWAAMLARCGGEKGFHPLSDQLMKQAPEWSRAANVGDELRKIGRRNGLSSAQIDACFTDQDYARSLVERYQETATEDGVRSTPTFIINGEKHTGNMPFEDFAALIDQHL